MKVRAVEWTSAQDVGQNFVVSAEKKNKVFNYVDKLPRSVNLCSPFSSHIPYSAKQQVLRGSLELRKQWFPGFL